MTLSRDTKERAFAMYCLGIPAVKIAETLHLRDSAIISIWKSKYNWDDKLNEFLKNKDRNDNILDNKQQIKVVESIIALWCEAMREDKEKLRNKINPKDLLEAIKVHRLIDGASTENINVTGKMELSDFIRDIRERRKRGANP